MKESRTDQGNLIPAFSYLKVTAIFLAVAVIVTAVIVTFIVINNKKNKDNENAMLESYVPSTYYPTFKKGQVVTTNSEQLGGIPVNQQAIDNITYLKRQKEKAILEEKAAKEEAEILAEIAIEEELAKQPLEPTESELRKAALLKQLQNLRDERRLVLLSRRGKDVNGWGYPSSFADDVTTLDSNGKDPLMSDDFSQHGVPKDESTLKVDLSRTITADRYIACVLVDQVNSQVEGRATCRAESNVFGFHGRNILIPAGSVFIGTHGTLKKVGDERFSINWTRLIRPDGVHVSLTNAYGSDLVGGTGIAGEVDNRNWDKYSGALLTSTVSVLAQMAIPSNGSYLVNNAVEQYGTDLGRVTAAILQDKINIKPYSVVPAGTRVLVTPSTDIWLKKVKNNLSFANVTQ